ncbi:MAG: hypothetical protein WC489_00370 [Patescibacteria group bacterium]
MTHYEPGVQILLTQALTRSRASSGCHYPAMEFDDPRTTIARLFDPLYNASWIEGFQPARFRQQQDVIGVNTKEIHDFEIQLGDWSSLGFVRVKTVDEDYMRSFNGKQTADGLTARTIRDQHMVLLNGCWAEDTIIVDFIIQVMNLQGIWGKQEEVEALLRQLPEDIVRRYYAGYYSADQYRYKFLAWVNRSDRSAGDNHNHKKKK